MAGVRHNSWMIPAFHAVVDNRFKQGHDDQQNFDIKALAAAVERHFAALN
ncbi:MAG: hypothetical protein M3R64_08320 [Pseudomonadota bacterium]|nr:hypothetical protein [Pseudomonadota bacterium]